MGPKKYEPPHFVIGTPIRPNTHPLEVQEGTVLTQIFGALRIISGSLNSFHQSSSDGFDL